MDDSSRLAQGWAPVTSDNSARKRDNVIKLGTRLYASGLSHKRMQRGCCVVYGTRKSLLTLGSSPVTACLWLYRRMGKEIG